MNFQEPYRIHQIDFNNLVYTKIKNNDAKKIIFIKYQDNKKQTPFVIQLPSLLNINETSKVTNDYHELEIPLITQESDKAELLFNFFEELDRKIMSDAKINSHMWFDTFLKKDSIKYKKIVKESDVFPNGIIKIKIIKNNDFETMLQIDNKNRISINKIPINYWCKMLIEVYALVINSQTNTFSLFLRPIILSFKDKQSKIYNYKFLEDSDSDKDEMDVPDSELSSIFMKQKYNTNTNSNDLTSSQIFIKDQHILDNLNKNNLSTSSTSDDYDRMSKELTTSNSTSSTTDDEKFKELNEKSESSETSKSSSENKLDVQNVNLEEFKNENETNNQEDTPDTNSEENNLKKLKEENELKLSESTSESELSESSDRIKLTDSTSEEEYLTKIKKELDSIN